MSNMKYNSLLSQLYRVQLFHPVKNGLESMKSLTRLVQCDLNGIPVVHVAGTNGKGTVCLKVAEALRHAGYKTGLYTSPHVSSFRERVQINGSLISEDDVVEGLETIFTMCESHSIPATFFEITTALAFRHFTRQAVDIAVIEVGLGGRLDATNILHPSLSVITSIQMDHMKILGDTIEAIAAEKAGIIKPKCPVLVSESCPVTQLKSIAELRSSPCYLVQDVLNLNSNSANKIIHSDTETSLPIDTDRSSANIAHAALLLLQQHLSLTLPPAAIEAGLSAALPCRFQEFKYKHFETLVTCVLDIAHNIAAMESLVKRIRHKVVFGMSADKDVIKCAAVIKALVEDSSQIHCVAVRVFLCWFLVTLLQARHSRALSVTDLQKLFGNEHIPQEKSIEASLLVALAEAAHNKQQGRDEIVIVCGSVFIMSEARKVLGISEPCDSISFDSKYNIK